jgi:hypothetical protein
VLGPSFRLTHRPAAVPARAFLTDHREHDLAKDARSRVRKASRVTADIQCPTEESKCEK